MLEKTKWRVYKYLWLKFTEVDTFLSNNIAKWIKTQLTKIVRIQVDVGRFNFTGEKYSDIDSKRRNIMNLNILY